MRFLNFKRAGTEKKTEKISLQSMANVPPEDSSRDESEILREKYPGAIDWALWHKRGRGQRSDFPYITGVEPRLVVCTAFYGFAFAKEISVNQVEWCSLQEIDQREASRYVASDEQCVCR